MDSLHSVLRSIRGDRPRRDHLAVFREFLSHLDRASRAASARDVKAARGVRRKPRRGKK
jgi:hypothetical protein